MDKKIINVLEQISKYYFKNMFDVEINIDQDESYQESEKPTFNTEIIAYIGLAGKKHQGQIIMGFSRKLPSKLVSKYTQNMSDDEKLNFGQSAVCEILNNLGGLLARHEFLKDKYPEISQTLPVLNDTKEDSVYFMKSDGGTLKFNCFGEDIYIFLSLKEFFSSQIKTNMDNFKDSLL